MSEENYQTQPYADMSQQAIQRYESSTGKEINFEKKVPLIQIWGLIKSLDEIMKESPEENKQAQ